MAKKRLSREQLFSELNSLATGLQVTAVSLMTNAAEKTLEDKYPLIKARIEQEIAYNLIPNLIKFFIDVNRFTYPDGRTNGVGLENLNAFQHLTPSYLAKKSSVKALGVTPMAPRYFYSGGYFQTGQEYILLKDYLKSISKNADNIFGSIGDDAVFRVSYVNDSGVIFRSSGNRTVKNKESGTYVKSFTYYSDTRGKRTKPPTGLQVQLRVFPKLTGTISPEKLLDPINSRATGYAQSKLLGWTPVGQHYRPAVPALLNWYSMVRFPAIIKSVLQG